jgi:purine nucleosidase/pyrimidine-specific ribonucleoside hydrolase
VGVDDALALILAFQTPELEIKAITGVSGNVPLDMVYRNIKRVLSLVQPEDRPYIARGADHPLTGKPVHAYGAHGSDGLGGASIGITGGEKWWRSTEMAAPELICKMAREDPGNLTLIAIGPLTNIALALENNPEDAMKIKEIICMGGVVRKRGNVTLYAEFNIFADAVAARMVIESGLPTTLIPLDITHQVGLTPKMIKERIEPLDTPFSRFLIQAVRFDSATGKFSRDIEAFYLHDPLAVGFAIYPNLISTENLVIKIETEKGDHFGQTIEIKDERAGEGKKVDVGLKVDSGRFLDLFISALER